MFHPTSPVRPSSACSSYSSTNLAPISQKYSTPHLLFTHHRRVPLILLQTSHLSHSNIPRHISCSPIINVIFLLFYRHYTSRIISAYFLTFHADPTLPNKRYKHLTPHLLFTLIRCCPFISLQTLHPP